MKPLPLVSIVIPAYNPRFFDQALLSALAQTYENIEIIVCDDCIDDAIKKIVDSFFELAPVPLRYLRNTENLGFDANLRLGIEAAQGEFLKVLCDDDVLFSECINRQAQVLTEQADVNLVFGMRLLTDENSFALPMRIDNCGLAPTDTIFKGDDLLAIFEEIPRNVLGNFTAALMRRSDLLALIPALTKPTGGFIARLDFALFVCLLRRGNTAMLAQVLCTERLHEHQLSKQPHIVAAAAIELAWLKTMLGARSGESPPASGWVRHVELETPDSDCGRAWKELCLKLILSNRQNAFEARIGTRSESYSEFYQEWLAARRFTEVERQLMSRKLAAWPQQPTLVPIIIDTAGERGPLRTTLQSLQNQLYGPHKVVLLSNVLYEAKSDVLQLSIDQDWVHQLNDLLPSLEGCDWFYLLHAGDKLADSALLLLAERVAHLPGIRCVYSDEGALLNGESGEPVFKPDFNLDLMRSYPYVGRVLAFKRESILELGGFDCALAELAPQDALWRLVEAVGPQTIEHIAEIQVESTLSFAQWLSRPQVIERSAMLVAAHLDRLGVQHRLHADQLPVLNHVEYLHDHKPVVSIIIQAGAELPGLQRCVESLFATTRYAHYEILLVDNGIGGTDMAQWVLAMTQLGTSMLRVISVPGVQNHAAIHNIAANKARGEYLVLLNAHSVICAADWLDQLLNHAQRPEVGVVGARVLTPQGKVLRAGLVLGMAGPANSAFQNEDCEARGYLQRLCVAQNWSAVSGDCLMVRKQVFNEVGQLDEQAFSLGLNDLDLCLRVGQAGYLVVWTPHANVTLGASAQKILGSVAHELQLREQETFYQRWLPKVARDPAYNPQLSINNSNFRLESGTRGSWDPLYTRSAPSILALPINSSAVGQYRVIGPFKALEAAGQVVGRIVYEPPSVVDIERMSPDMILFQCRYGQGSVDELQRIKTYSNARRIFELDDYVISAPKKNSHARNKAANIEEIVRKAIGLCDRVVVTTDALADALSSMHQDIRVVPNTLVPQLWGGLRARRATSSKPRVGWGGGTSHTGDLEIIAQVVRELANDVEWVFFGMCPEGLLPYIHEFHASVSLKDYPAKLSSLNLDLALAPLEQHIFNDCKSNLRLLEYGACAYPVICSDTKAYRGNLPCTRVPSNSTEDWLSAIRMHLSDPVESYRMGDALHEAVMSNWLLRGDNLQRWLNAWVGQ
ncbi:glycosyltransferase [Pseudomonas sp. SWRI92]|uniref:glycosyltransferase n=1 Tax=Pseudomonas sp. SWRI92 TaxID=2745499 RepID=UPI00164791F0|nr:glycosyltransferase [Pseudomonas sp. SWRI92]